MRNIFQVKDRKYSANTGGESPSLKIFLVDMTTSVDLLHHSDCHTWATVIWDSSANRHCWGGQNMSPRRWHSAQHWLVCSTENIYFFYSDSSRCVRV